MGYDGGTCKSDHRSKEAVIWNHDSEFRSKTFRQIRIVIMRVLHVCYAYMSN